MSEREWVLFLLIVILYSAFARWLGRYSITMPLVLVASCALLGPGALDLLDIPASAENAKRVTEVTLALLLFADASTLNLREARLDAGLPRRLLFIGLPLTVIVGAAAAYLFFPDEKIGFALLIGAILAPTDAALGMPIFNNPRVPSRIRRALNIESGLNDGIATPMVTLFLALAVEEVGTSHGSWFFDALSDIGLAIGVGVVVGLVGGKVFMAAVAKGWTSATSQRIGNLALALAAYWSALAVGGNGFIAAFVGGLAFGATTRYTLRGATDFTDEFGAVLSTIVWGLFGVSIVVPLLRDFMPRAFVFALIALTIARMVPVAISLIGTGMRRDTVLVMGWLGPRGLASVVFMLIAIEAFHEAGRGSDTLTAMVGWTITLSVVLHAVTAAPLAEWYATRLKTATRNAPELLPIPELPAHQAPGKHRSFVHSQSLRDEPGAKIPG